MRRVSACSDEASVGESALLLIFQLSRLFVLVQRRNNSWETQSKMFDGSNSVTSVSDASDAQSSVQRAYHMARVRCVADMSDALMCPSVRVQLDDRDLSLFGHGPTRDWLTLSCFFFFYDFLNSYAPNQYCTYGQ